MIYFILGHGKDLWVSSFANSSTWWFYPLNAEVFSFSATFFAVFVVVSFSLVIILILQIVVVWDSNFILFFLKMFNFFSYIYVYFFFRDLVPILSVCQYSSYFTNLFVDGIKLSTELVDIIIGIVRNSQSLASLTLKNCSLPRLIFWFWIICNNFCVKDLQSAED